MPPNLCAGQRPPPRAAAPGEMRSGRRRRTGRSCRSRRVEAPSRSRARSRRGRRGRAPRRQPPGSPVRRRAPAARTVRGVASSPPARRRWEAHASREAPARCREHGDARPHDEADDDRASREDRSGLRQVDPEGDEERVQALADTESEEQADDRREETDHEPLHDDRPSTWRREPPSVRNVASSRGRCATVIDSVLKMTNAPTKSATPPKPSRK